MRKVNLSDFTKTTRIGDQWAHASTLLEAEISQLGPARPPHGGRSDAGLQQQSPPSAADVVPCLRQEAWLQRVIPATAAAAAAAGGGGGSGGYCHAAMAHVY